MVDTKECGSHFTIVINLTFFHVSLRFLDPYPSQKTQKPFIPSVQRSIPFRTHITHASNDEINNININNHSKPTLVLLIRFLTLIFFFFRRFLYLYVTRAEISIFKSHAFSMNTRH